MTTADPPTSPLTSRLTYVPVGVAASLVHLLMMIPGYSEDGALQWGAWLGVLAVSAVVAALVFVFVVPGGGAVTGVVLGAVGLASVLIFWAGVTLPLAAAAGLVGWHARQRADRPGLANASLALAVVSIIGLVAIIIGDAAAN
jgi:hypothetical protein